MITHCSQLISLILYVLLTVFYLKVPSVLGEVCFVHGLLVTIHTPWLLHLFDLHHLLNDLLIHVYFLLLLVRLGFEACVHAFQGGDGVLAVSEVSRKLFDLLHIH